MLGGGEGRGWGAAKGVLVEWNETGQKIGERSANDEIYE